MKSHFLCFFFICICLLNCGRKKTEKDKYPDMPIFPKGTNNTLKVSELNDKYHDFYHFDDIFFSFRNIRGIGKYLYFFNEDLIKKDSIKLYNDNYVLKNGIIYSLNFNEDKAIQLDIKTGKKYYMTFHNFNSEKLYEIYKKKLDKNVISKNESISDSLKTINSINRVNTINQKIAEEFNKKVISGLNHISFLNNGLYILEYKNEKVLFNSHKNSSLNETSSKTIFENFKSFEILQKEKNYHFKHAPVITVFDKDILDNKLGAGRFNFFLHQSGYLYCNLTYKNKETKFKVFSKYLNIDVLKAFYTPNNNAIIIFNTEENIMKRKYYKIE